MKVICVDDEPLAVDYTLGQCAKLPDIDEAKGFTDAWLALDWLQTHTVAKISDRVTPTPCLSTR